jgi:hypothetical protein
MIMFIKQHSENCEKLDPGLRKSCRGVGHRAFSSKIILSFLILFKLASVIVDVYL